jgi:hypothetical protein
MIGLGIFVLPATLARLLAAMLRLEIAAALEALHLVASPRIRTPGFVTQDTIDPNDFA